METTRATLEAPSTTSQRRRGPLARLAIAATMGLTLCLGIAAAGFVASDSASGGPGTVLRVFPADSASGGPGTVFVIPADSASGGPGTV